MNTPNHTSNTNTNLNSNQALPSTPRSDSKATPAGPVIRTTARDYANPVDYQHPYESMARFAKVLALRYDANRTRHAYYRHLRLIQAHFNCDPALLTETQLRDYFLFVKLKKGWKPKTIRQTLAKACAPPLMVLPPSSIPGLNVWISTLIFIAWFPAPDSMPELSS